MDDLFFTTTFDSPIWNWGDRYFFEVCRENGTISMILNIIGIVVNTIALFIVLTVSIITIRNMRKLSNMSNLLKSIFYCSIFGSVMLVVGGIWIYMACFIYEISDSSLIAAYLTTFGYYLYLDCILATLVARLYTTFKGSVYELSKMTKIGFLLLAFLLGILYIFIMIINALLLWGKNAEKKLIGFEVQWILYCVKTFLYAVCSITAVYIFCRNLLALTLLQTQDTNKSALTPSGLNIRQKKMIFMASKYVGLFLVAILSSMISVVFNGLTHFGLLPFQITTIIYAIDCVINIVSICLQFVFANDYYLRWCRFIDVCCRKIMTRSAQKSLSEVHKKEGYEVVKLDTTETELTDAPTETDA